MVRVSVLRYGHRSVRDYRVTSHCALVARAFGAGKIIICGEEDESIRRSIEKVVEKWGGTFSIGFSDSWKNEFKKFRKNRNSAIVHLTMYGIPLQKAIGKIRKFRNIMVVIGSQKVEGAVYENSDFNVGVTQQPHSEIAALAVFLHELFRGKGLGGRFPNAKIRIIPKEKGKKVVKRE
ncbi:MAG: tRNA (cytidine(56)-2'-O)-methyltransferase [Candidatus Diapherotrites archaeon]|uniref:tRNA (cytidine(56)-2'-O)-methyltransferase n=1 Tax=Candidatus Iainarchaeum sp. TaxID=3101447 RepID=A0A8T4KZC0_9ARCH|nr:tRNA (cytidine(56)-2'-O)-methyltransferase [Candidatus Diapherotrites archaeon]